MACGLGSNTCSRQLLAFYAHLLLVVPALLADIVVLADGRVLEGEVQLEGNEYVIKGAYGIVVRVPKNEVKEIRRTRPPAEIFKERCAELARAPEATAAAWFELARYAQKYGLEQEAAEAYSKVLELEPEHAGAREALGYVRHAGEWKTRAGLLAAGYVEVNGKWMTREEAERLEAAEKSAAPPAGGQVAGAPAGFRKVTFVNCPKCGGSGISVWLQCPQCARSPRQGYLFMGDHMELCNRCWGAGKLPGLKCDVCGGKGKVNPDRMPEQKPPTPPAGYMFCLSCNGTGVELWLPCPQCARSPEPGYTFHGDYLAVCTRCGGRGKLPGTQCGKCAGRGIIKPANP